MNQSNILVRGTNWVGDAVMTLPALAALAANFPQSKLTVMTRPWALDIYQNHPGVTGTLPYDKGGSHRGFRGHRAIIKQMKAEKFDLAVLFQNAFGAALLARLAGINKRIGYARDGRKFLLTDAVKLRPEDRFCHEVFYYLNILESCGLAAPFSQPRFYPSSEAILQAEELWANYKFDKGELALAIAPGAAFGSAKRWPVANFAAAASEILAKHPGRAIILGGPGETEVAAELARQLPPNTINLAGQTTLATTGALLAKVGLVLTNDSGLMHLAGAQENTPLVAVYGPTNPLTTAPLSHKSRRLVSTSPCAPCLKRECPLEERVCFDNITPSAVAQTALDLLEPPTNPNQKPAVFLDRDGTLIEEVNFLCRPEDVKLTSGAGEAVAALNRAGYKVILVTNQSGIARGLFSEDDLEKVHHHINGLLTAGGGGHLDAIYYCPHHPQEGTRPELVRECDCRKPGVGMFKQAADEHDLDLRKSFWIGDRARDWGMAEKLGGRSIHVLTGHGLTEAQEGLKIMPTLAAPNLRRAVEWILS